MQKNAYPLKLKMTWNWSLHMSQAWDI